jgi:Protein of unknown function (DUF4019)
MKRGGSPTVTEGVIRIIRRPPLRSGYGPALTVLVFSCVMIFAACSQGIRREGIPANAQSVLNTSIEDIDAGRYEKLYHEAGDEWRNAATLDESKATMQKMRDKLGKVRTRDLQTAREEQTATGPIPGHSLVVVYQTSFEHGDGMETFTLMEHRGQWYLARYFVSSSALK